MATAFPYIVGGAVIYYLGRKMTENSRMRARGKLIDSQRFVDQVQREPGYARDDKVENMLRFSDAFTEKELERRGLVLGDYDYYTQYQSEENQFRKVYEDPNTEIAYHLNHFTNKTNPSFFRYV